MAEVTLQQLFTPGKIGGVSIPNRIVCTSMVTNYCDDDGRATDRFVDYFEAKARGGYGLIMSEALVVDPAGKGFANEAGIWEDGQIEGLSRMTAAIHRHGSRTFAQLLHAGRQTTSQTTGGIRPEAPSPIPCPVRREMPRELTVRDIGRLVSRFGDAAVRAERAGFDGVEVHAGHGYLVAEFLSSYANRRTDSYGGSLRNRLRFLSEIIAEIRARTGRGFPLGVRISAEEYVPGGRTMEDTRAIALFLERECRIDYVNLSFGTYGDGGATAPMYLGHAFRVHYAEELKKTVSIPVITVGRINDPLLAEALLVSGKADFVAMTRASLADPDLPRKAREGEWEDIRQCIGCMQGCLDLLQANKPIRCLVNPSIGFEYADDLSRTSAPKNVAVVGGGPAGIEAARAAALRGHRVTLFEHRAFLGGQFALGAYPPAKGEFASYAAWAAQALQKLGVQVRLETKADVDSLRALSPDLVLCATGGVPLRPSIPGIDGENVVLAQDVLAGTVSVGGNVVVAGGGLVGAETAAHLGFLGKRVTLVEMLPAVAGDDSPPRRPHLMGLLAKYGVTILTNTKIVGIGMDRVLTETSGEAKSLPAETVVLAFGSAPDSSLCDALRAAGIDAVAVGDAVSVSNALEATRSGYEAGLRI